MYATHTRKLWPLLTAGILAALSLSGCQSSLSPDGQTAVTLSEVAHSIFYAPQYAAIELGYFEEEGIDLTLVNAGGADKVMTSLISGDAQIGFMGSEAYLLISQELETESEDTGNSSLSPQERSLRGSKPVQRKEWEETKTL